MHSIGQTKTRFSQKLSDLELWPLLTTSRKSYMGFSKKLIHGPLKFKMADGCRIENRFLAITDFNDILQGEAVFHRISAVGHHTRVPQNVFFFVLSRRSR